MSAITDHGGRRHLVLVSNRRINARSDFEQIAERVERLDPGIAAHVVDGGAYAPTRWRRWAARGRLVTRPTLVVAPHRDDAFDPPRGLVRTGNRMSKVEEYKRLREHGIPVPELVEWTEDHQPPIGHLGEFVVVKPAYGTKGDHVYLERAEDVRWRGFDVELTGRSESMIVQQFIDTDPFPGYFRVLTLFGEPLFCLHNGATTNWRDGRSEDRAAWKIVARGDDRAQRMHHDDEVVAFAVRAAAAFGEVPLCGIDIVRDATTGDLFVLEMNTWGFVWYFSAPGADEINARFGLDLYGQYGALDIAAHSLVAKTRELLG